MHDKKKIGLISGLAMGVGCVIGTGIFGSMPEVVNAVGSGVVFCLILATIQSLLISVVFMYMNGIISSSSFKFMLLTKLIHPYVGYLATIAAVLQTLLITTYGVLFGNYFLVLFPNAPVNGPFVGCCLLLFVLATGLMGSKSVAALNNLWVVLLVAAMLLFSLMGIPAIDPTKINFSQVFSSGSSLVLIAANASLLSTAINGATSMCELADELEKPHRNLPIILLITPVLVALFYTLMGLATVGNADGQIETLADVANKFMSPGLVTLFVVGGPIMGILTSITPIVMGIAASIQYAAKLQILPAALTKVNRRGVAYWPLIIACAIPILIVATGVPYGPVMVCYSFSSNLCSLPVYIAPLWVHKRYPNSEAAATVKVPFSIIRICSIGLFCYTIYLITNQVLTMSPTAWTLLACVFVVAYIYFFFRVNWFKRRDVDLIATLRAPYEPWESRERELAARFGK